jgi:hypothetical protein
MDQTNRTHEPPRLRARAGSSVSTGFMALGNICPNAMDRFMHPTGMKRSLQLVQGENHGNCEKTGR